MKIAIITVFISGIIYFILRKRRRWRYESLDILFFLLLGAATILSCLFPIKEEEVGRKPANRVELNGEYYYFAPEVKDANGDIILKKVDQGVVVEGKNTTLFGLTEKTWKLQ